MLLTEYAAFSCGGADWSRAFSEAVAALEKQGGGVLTVPAGVYPTGPIELKSHMTLEVLSGAELRFHQDLNAFPLVDLEFEGIPGPGYKPCLYAKRSVVDSSPVAHDQSFKAPFSAKGLADQPGILRGMDPVDHIVARHDRADSGFLDSPPESREVYLVHRALVDDGAGSMTVVLGIIQGEVLDRRHDAFSLHTLDILDSRFGSEERILSEVFEITAVVGAAVDIDSGAEHDSDTAGFCVLGDAPAHFQDRVLVPGCRRCDAARIQGALGIVTDALRAVTHADGRDSEPVDRIRVESVYCPGNKIHFFFYYYYLFQLAMNIILLYFLYLFYMNQSNFHYFHLKIMHIRFFQNFR